VSRPSKLTDTRAARIVAAVAAGNTRAAAAGAGGIAPSTLYDWLARGRTGEDPYAGFAERLEGAELEFERQAVDAWVAHFPKDWRAIAEMLARRFSDRWRRDPVVNVEQHVAVPAAEPAETLTLAQQVEGMLASYEHTAGVLDAMAEARGLPAETEALIARARERYVTNGHAS
jgi:hypothetical protein